jgi:hypothetical protein
MTYTFTFVSLLLTTVGAFAQSVNSEILGAVQDQSGAAITGAKISALNQETNITREAVADDQGRFRITLLRPGLYTITVEKEGFSKYQEGPFELRLNQAAEFGVKLRVGQLSEVVSVTGESPVVNTTNAEVSTTFEGKRIAEVPLAVNRNVLNLALNVAGVSQLSSGQSVFASGLAMAVNGMRTRSNNFMIDGQDSNDPSVTGSTQGINNPDVVAEFRVITNQFAAEYGRAAGSIVNIITKSGSNQFHGSGFVFNNNRVFNTRSNLDKAARLETTPFRNETQLGGTLGGPIRKDKTFFFASYQRWWDRRLSSGSSIEGAPTAEGRSALQPFASRPAVKALLDYLPAAAVPNGQVARAVVGGQNIAVPLGRLAGTSGRKIDDTQWSSRVDHQLTSKHTLGGRYMYQDQTDAGGGQVTPPGNTTLVPIRNQIATVFLNSNLRSNLFSEFRLAYVRQAQETTAQDVRSQAIPSIEVNELGLTGFNAATSRTGIGLAVNLPQFRKSNTYQIQQNLGWLAGSHNIKFGYDIRRSQTASFFVPTTRGRLVYNNMQDLIDDVAQSTQINGPIRGGQIMQYYKTYDFFFYAQDEFRIRPNLTINYGLRYELPGNPFANLTPVNERILAANGNNEAFRFVAPPRDTNNWQPRVGFNYRIGGDNFLTGNGKLVLRGGYARTYDFAFLNIALNIFSAFPFVNSFNLNPRTPNSYPDLLTALNNPVNPGALTRTNVSPDFRSPLSDQFSIGIQRQLGDGLGMTVTWIGTKGQSLFQTNDGNRPVRIALGSIAANGTYNFTLSAREDPTRAVVRQRANTAESIYHSLQTSLERRFRRGLSFGGHYTWSTFIDTASEVFNPAVNGDIAIAQDPFNLKNDRARSTYDRPHRFTMTHTYEIPEIGLPGKILGKGWQLSGYLTFQSGAPFTPLNGTDPFLRNAGIDGLVGNALRPNVATTLDVSGMTISDLYAVRTSLFSPVVANATTAGRTMTVGQTLDIANTPIGFGNAGRNILRADGIANYDFSVAKISRINENHQLQFRMDVYNLTNTRNFGIPESRVNSANLLNQWGQDGGNRRIQFGVRYVF